MFRGLERYRRYVINHEFGHGHATCSGPGELAPVMMQQTIFTRRMRTQRLALPGRGRLKRKARDRSSRRHRRMSSLTQT